MRSTWRLSCSQSEEDRAGVVQSRTRLRSTSHQRRRKKAPHRPLSLSFSKCPRRNRCNGQHLYAQLSSHCAVCVCVVVYTADCDNLWYRWETRGSDISSLIMRFLSMLGVSTTNIYLSLMRNEFNEGLAPLKKESKSKRKEKTSEKARFVCFVGVRTDVLLSFVLLSRHLPFSSSFSSFWSPCLASCVFCFFLSFSLSPLLSRSLFVVHFCNLSSSFSFSLCVSILFNLFFHHLLLG